MGENKQSPPPSTQMGLPSPPSPRVCVVGAGMTGICACKYLLQHGIQPVVLEAQPEIGGVWRLTFESTKLQTPRDAYQFSDFLWPPGTPDYPSHTDVKEYLHSYANRFKVMDCIRFNCKVVEVRRVSPVDGCDNSHDGSNGEQICKGCGWSVRIEGASVDREAGHGGSEVDTEWLFFEFLILSIGLFGDVPKLPNYPPSKGPEVFQGKVLHSMEYAMLDNGAARDLLKDKRVVVIGMMKSALDVAAEAADANQGVQSHPCKVIFRSASWMLPHYKAFGVPLAYLYATRLSELMIPKPDQGFLLSVFSTLLTPARWATSKFVELYLLFTLPLRELGLVPNEAFYRQFATCQVPLLPETFFERVKAGHINLHRAADWSFSKTGVVADGTNIDADVIILGTGYDGLKKLRSLLQQECQELQGLGSVLPLYRGVIHPRIPQLAIMGFHENLSNLHSSEMSARWLAHLLSRKITLPSIDKMENVTQKWIEYMKYSKSCVGAVSIWHSDQVCKDLGWNPRRKRNVFEELFVPYSNMDYKEEAH